MSGEENTTGLRWQTNHLGEWNLLSQEAGKVIAQVLFWPHYRGDWLTIKEPEDWRDSGMKRYRTPKGAGLTSSKNFRYLLKYPLTCPHNADYILVNGKGVGPGQIEG